MADFVSCALYSQQGSPVNAIGASSDFNHLILACCDGSMRKLDFYGSMNGRQLSVAGGAVVAKKSAIDNSLKEGIAVLQWSYAMPTQESGIHAASDSKEPIYAAASISKQQSLKEQTMKPKKLVQVTAMACEKNGLFAICGTESGQVRLCTIRTHPGLVHHVFSGNNVPNDGISHAVSKYSRVSCISLASDMFLSGSWDRSITEWDLNVGLQRVKVPTSHQSHVTHVAYLPSDPCVAYSTSIDGTLKLWDFRSSTAKDVTPSKIIETCATKKSSKWILTADASKDGKLIALGKKDGSLELWDLYSGKLFYTYKFSELSGAIYKLKFTPDSRFLICGSFDNIRSMEMNNLTNKHPFRIIPGHHGGSISDIVLTEDGKYMISSSGARGYEDKSNNLTYMFYSHSKFNPN